MLQVEPLGILKGAILLERQGKSFYEFASHHTESKVVGEIFRTLAIEEESHIAILEKEYSNLQREGKFTPPKMDKGSSVVTKAVLTKEVRKEISAAGYEAAAISAAMAMEEKAVKFYAESAASTDDPVAKRLYRWLADWEKSHLVFLSELDEELRESIWYDNKFWPIY